MTETNPYDNWPGYPTFETDTVAALYRKYGVEPPWTRVWSGGVDVTDEDPASWPWPWSKYYAEGWRPSEVN